MKSWTRQQISDATAFDYGDEFTSVPQIHAYFTEDAQAEMFGQMTSDEQAEMPMLMQTDLDRMAEIVIVNHWHCVTGPLAWPEVRV